MKRFFAVMFAILLFVSILPVSAAHVHAVESTEGYDQLTNDKERLAYAILEEEIASLSPVITFPEDADIFFTDLKNAARAACLDHPDYFWFLESWFYNYEAEMHGKQKIQVLRPNYHLNGKKVSAGSQELLEAQIAFYEKAEEIVTGIPVNLSSEYEIALYLHDYLINHITYSLDGNHDSAYSALVNGQAACYGYSKAYQYLLNAAGIRARTITGSCVDSNGNKVGHAWNEVWIDGACYFTDVTWDDWEDATIHSYFMIDLQTMSADHTPDSMFTFDACDHKIDFYDSYVGKGVADCNENTTGQELAKHFRRVPTDKSGSRFDCEIRMDGDLNAWFRKISNDLSYALGLSYRANMNYYYSDDMYYLIIEDPAYTPPKVAAESITLNTTDAVLTENGGQLQLIADILAAKAVFVLPVFTSSDETVAIVDEYGMVTAVNPGTATITASIGDNGVAASCNITVTHKPQHQHTLRHMPPSAPSCTLNGCESYYLCTTCGRRYADGNAQTEITDVSQHAIPPTGHLDIQWEGDRELHIKKCSCGTEFSDTLGYHEDKDQNMRCDICDAPYKSLPVKQLDTSKSKPVAKWVLPVLIGVAVVGIGTVVTVIIVRKRRWKL